MKKNIEWLRKEFDEVLEFRKQSNPSSSWGMGSNTVLKYIKEDFKNLINQLDEPETLSQEWIGENKFEVNGWNEAVHVEDLQNLLVPKQEEVDRAYKDGYEKGKQHTFYKGYLEGLEDKGSEPETVADVVTTFWKSYERLKEVMSMEVEELEE